MARPQRNKLRVGFIGVGLMGHGMAKNLVEKGYPLTVMGHRNRDPVEDLKRRGAKEAKSPAALAKASDVIFVCVTSSVQVEDLILRKDGIAAGAKRGLIVIDTSTAEPDSTLKLAELLRKQGVSLIDAPLGNTPKEAEEGKLNAFVGADDATFRKVEPLIAAWAQKIIRTGPVGTGHKMKLLNNFLAMSYVALYAEAYSACRAAGVDERTFYDVIAAGGMHCGIFQRVSNWVIGKDPEAHKFAISNCLKDMRYFNRMVDACGMSSLVGPAVMQHYRIAVTQGEGDTYMPHLPDIWSRLNHLPTTEARQE